MDVSGVQKFRVVVDYRAINEKVIGDAYPLPNISKIRDYLAKAQYFSFLYLATGFHQVKIHFDDRAKTLSEGTEAFVYLDDFVVHYESFSIQDIYDSKTIQTIAKGGPTVTARLV